MFLYFIDKKSLEIFVYNTSCPLFRRPLPALLFAKWLQCKKSRKHATVAGSYFFRDRNDCFLMFSYSEQPCLSIIRGPTITEHMCPFMHFLSANLVTIWPCIYHIYTTVIFRATEFISMSAFFKMISPLFCVNYVSPSILFETDRRNWERLPLFVQLFICNFCGVPFVAIRPFVMNPLMAFGIGDGWQLTESVMVYLRRVFELNFNQLILINQIEAFSMGRSCHMDQVMGAISMHIGSWLAVTYILMAMDKKDSI